MQNRSVAFTLSNDHVDKDSAQWQKVATKQGNSGAVLPEQDVTQEDTSELPTPIHPTTTTPRREAKRRNAKRIRKRNPSCRQPTTPLVTETTTPPPPAATLPTPKISDQHFEAVVEYGQACYVTYMYGENQAMAMAVETKKSGKPFDP